MRGRDPSGAKLQGWPRGVGTLMSQTVVWDMRRGRLPASPAGRRVSSRTGSAKKRHGRSRTRTWSAGFVEACRRTRTILPATMISPPPANDSSEILSSVVVITRLEGVVSPGTSGPFCSTGPTNSRIPTAAAID